jgi:hypothetical protein
MLVTHICNPSYSGGRDQEDRYWKQAWAKNSARSYLEKTHHKKGMAQWLKVKALNSSPSAGKNTKQNLLRR